MLLHYRGYISDVCNADPILYIFRIRMIYFEGKMCYVTIRTHYLIFQIFDTNVVLNSLPL